jgi:hypothetical protein
LDWATDRVNVTPDSDALQASNYGPPPLAFAEMLTLEGSRQRLKWSSSSN